MRVRHAHFPRRSARCLNIDELAPADAGAPPARLVPRLSALNQFRPIGKAPALRWFSHMHAAPAAREKLALRVSRHAQAPQVFGPINIAALEFSGGCLQKGCEPANIVL